MLRYFESIKASTSEYFAIVDTDVFLNYDFSAESIIEKYLAQVPDVNIPCFNTDWTSNQY